MAIDYRVLPYLSWPHVTFDDWRRIMRRRDKVTFSVTIIATELDPGRAQDEAEAIKEALIRQKRRCTPIIYMPFRR